MNARRTVPLLLLSALTGCAPGLRDRVEDAQAWQQDKLAETEAFFKTNSAPLTLRTCRTLARQRTLKLTQANLDAELARLRAVGAFSAFLPQVKATYQRSGTTETPLTKIPVFGLSAQMQDKWTTETALTVTQPVFMPNAWLLWVAARRGADLQKLVAERNAQMLDVQVAALFYQAATADRAVEAYDAQAEASAELQKQIAALEREGLCLRGERARVEAFHLSDLHNAQVARDNAFAAKANLLDLMSFHPLAEAAPDPDGDSLLHVKALPWALTEADGSLRPVSRQEALAAPLEEWLWSALVNRRELWAQDMAITLRKVQALAALANFLPTLAVSGGKMHSSNSFLAPHNLTTGGIGGVVSLFDGLASISDYLAARKQQEAAYALREDAASALLVSVWQSWTQWRQARELKTVADAAKEAAELDYDETLARYRDDQETLSNLLDKFSAREQARISAVAAAYADALAEFVFRDAIGLGWGDAIPEDDALDTLPLLTKQE